VPHTMHVLYGSQTGTAEEVAWDIAREGCRSGVPCREPQAMSDVDLQSLCSLGFVVFVVATTGQGDPPINMRSLWQDMTVASLPKTLLQGLRFAVFGLGDSHYRQFNYCARKLQARLENLGAEPFFRLGLGDDQHDFGLEQELDPWIEGMWAALDELCPRRPPAAAATNGARTSTLECRYEVEVLEEAASQPPAAPVDQEGLFEATAGITDLCLGCAGLLNHLVQ